MIPMLQRRNEVDNDTLKFQPEDRSMRLIAWNANLNNRPRSLEETASLLAPLEPDVLVLSEVAAPREGNPLSASWIPGGRPGLAVIVAPGLTIHPHPADNDAPPCVGAFSIRGRIAFDLVAVWPVVTTKFPTYDQVLTATVDLFEGVLTSDHAILAGDFNSNTWVTSQRSSHPRLVSRLRSLGLVSVYHHLTGEAHGEEATPTYLHGHDPSKPFHLDYCFVSEAILQGSALEILQGDDWNQASDHYPLVLDAQDEGLTP